MAIMAWAVSCIDDRTCKGPEFEVAVSNLAFVSGGYYGEENHPGMAKYIFAVSADYDRSVKTRAPEGEMHIKDTFYLTLFSEVALDAEYACPAEGRYAVAPEEALSALLEGKSKEPDGYAGSYVVSGDGGILQESKITGGSVNVGYDNDKLVLILELKDEQGLLDKYAGTQLKYEGAAQFANNAIEYFVFNNPEDEYIRCWYFGEPSYDGRKSNDGTELGEYLFVFSNAPMAEVEKEGQASASFYLMNEYQLYGLDRYIAPGVYPVNQDGHNGKLGTLFLIDITDPYAPYSGTVAVKTFENGEAVRNYVVDGWLAIFGDDEDNPDRFVMNFTLEDGRKFHGRYDGPLSIGDEWTLSDFREDITVAEDELPGAYILIKDPDYWYRQAGTNQWQIYLTGPDVTAEMGEYGVEIAGSGDCFRIELATDPAAVDAIPEGVYEIKDSYEPGTAQQGDKSIGYIGIYVGAWFHRLSNNASPLNAMGLSGSVTVSRDGGRYTIEATLHDDAKNTITGKYVGVPTVEDHRTP